MTVFLNFEPGQPFSRHNIFAEPLEYFLLQIFKQEEEGEDEDDDDEITEQTNYNEGKGLRTYSGSFIRNI